MVFDILTGIYTYSVLTFISDHNLSVYFVYSSWLSNYPTEDEKLLIGGYESVQLNSIIISRLGHNYCHYIQAVGIIQNMFDGRTNPLRRKIKKKTINAVNELIQYKRNQRLLRLKESDEKEMELDIISDDEKENAEDDIEDYVKYLFTKFCENWKKPIQIDIVKFNKESEFLPFKPLIVNEDDSCIHIQTICEIFENIQCITITDGLNVTHNTFNTLLRSFKSVQQNIFTKLKRIEIDFMSTNDKYQMDDIKIEDINWEITDCTDCEQEKWIIIDIQDQIIKVSKNRNVVENTPMTPGLIGMTASSTSPNGETTGMEEMVHSHTPMTPI